MVHLFVYFYSFICLVLFIHIESYREVEIKAERSILSTSHQHPTLASSYLSPTILETQRTFLRCIWATENHQGHQGPAGSMGPTQASHSFALRNPNTSETSSLAGWSFWCLLREGALWSVGHAMFESCLVFKNAWGLPVVVIWWAPMEL